MPTLTPYEYLKNRTKLLRKRSIHRFKLRAKYLFKRKAIKPYLVLATKRSGSNLLLDYLNSIPSVNFASEVLHKEMFYGIRHKKISIHSVLRHIVYSVHGCANTICGASLLKYQIYALGITPAHLCSLWPNTRFIVLYRKSLMDQYVSLKLAESTHEWLGLRPHPKTLSIRVSEGDFRDFCAQTSKFYEMFLNHSRLRKQCLLLSYEELTSEPQEIFDTLIFPFLKSASHPVKTRLVKQNVRNLHETIENYEEIKHVLNEDWAHLDYSDTQDPARVAYGVTA